MFIHGVRKIILLTLAGACGVVPVACLFSPIDYSGRGNEGGGLCTSVDGCTDPDDCRSVTCVGSKCDTANAAADKVIPQIQHDCLKRQCDGKGNVESVSDPGDLPANDDNACTLEDCDDATPPFAPAGAPCLHGVCDGAGKCESCNDGIKNGNEVDVDCGGPQCPHCDGETCSGDPAACQSGYCIDGICCSTGCDQQCEACVVALTGAPSGTCAPVLLGQPDGNACDGLGGCGLDHHCACSDGVKNQGEVGVDCGGSCSTACASGTPCQADFDCKSGSCSDGVCCGSACNGNCERCDVPGSVGTCLPVPALTQGKCPLDQVCDTGGSCRKTVGESCSAAAQCANGFCADGVCCESACDGACRSCSAAVKQQGEDGVCGFIKLGSDPESECVNGCNGAGACSP